jgi:protein-S-isoprenylcysteine O-methyltransferase Ste14
MPGWMISAHADIIAAGIFVWRWKMLELFTNLILLALTWGIWLWFATRQPEPVIDLVIASAGSLSVIPLVFLGRRLLDHQPNMRQAERVTTALHYLLAILLGSAILAATRLGLNSHAWLIPLSPVIGLILMIIAGSLLVLVIFNLVLKGLGMPFALSLTRVMVTEWSYAWTRNPMILSALAFLVGLGLWLRSAIFLIWLLIVLGPVIFVFLKVYEERELEIRFGANYLDYRQRTPMFFPKRPTGKPG